MERFNGFVWKDLWGSYGYQHADACEVALGVDLRGRNRLHVPHHNRLAHELKSPGGCKRISHLQGGLNKSPRGRKKFSRDAYTNPQGGVGSKVTSMPTPARWRWGSIFEDEIAFTCCTTVSLSWVRIPA